MGVEVLGSADSVNSIGCPFADGVIVVVSKVSGEFSAVTDSGGVNHSDSQVSLRLSVVPPRIRLTGVAYTLFTQLV